MGKWSGMKGYVESRESFYDGRNDSTEGGKSSIKGREGGRNEGRRCRKEGNYQRNIFK